MTRTQRFLLSVLIVVSVPLALYALGLTMPAPPSPAPPVPSAPPIADSKASDLSGHWQGVWDDGTMRFVFSLQLAHRRPEDFIHATGSVMRIRKGVVVDSILTVSLGGHVAGDRLELGAPPPWTRTTVTGSFAGTLAPDRRSARGEVMGLGGAVLPLDLRLVTPAVNRAEGAYSLPESFPVD